MHVNADIPAWKSGGQLCLEEPYVHATNNTADIVRDLAEIELGNDSLGYGAMPKTI